MPEITLSIVCMSPFYREALVKARGWALFKELRLSRGPCAFEAGKTRSSSPGPTAESDHTPSLPNEIEEPFFPPLLWGGKMKPIVLFMQMLVYVSDGAPPSRAADFSSLVNAVIGFASHILTSINICSLTNCPLLPALHFIPLSDSGVCVGVSVRVQ